ncbi:hypothetical protein JCGZ_06985 [Jatropha curcas]|uniref:Myb-like domain-containing protein n=1 Tax=Jatropha curcas TaxID=180498 RepID=A0A067KNM3_JATCU|nr:trihelix transcription factor ASR3 [Jatropha curcas]KDP33414.1 hypothetical protein JCGZ_06985 [Jatropha curcas]
MEPIESTDELQNSRTPQKRGFRLRQGMEDSYSYKSSVARAPRTRSQVAPVWTNKEALILVNEIAAVEGDCLKALSSYQKWKIIVENCTVMDVSRTLNQCRSKWNSLLAEYNQIKQWDSKSKTESYWLLDCETRKQFRLPESFDKDLFKAIDNYVRAQKDHADTDPDTDPEVEANLLNVIAKLGPKRQRRRSVVLKTQQEEKHQICLTIEQPQEVHIDEESQKNCEEENHQMIGEKPQPQIVHVDEEPQESRVEDKPQESCRKEEAQKINAEEKYQNSLVEEQPKSIRKRKKKTACMQETEKMMVERLCENAELIHAIAQGNVPGIAEFQTDFVRRQGDKLIACLGDIVDILGQFPYLVQE